MGADAGYYQELLSGLVRGRRTILAGLPVAAATAWVASLRALGGDRCFIVAPSIGTGPLPDAADAEWLDLDITAADPVEEFRTFEQAMAHPPPALVAALGRFDPRGRALTLVAPFHAVGHVAGRSAYGARRPAWVALEDKTTVDRLWDAVGVAHPPSVVVPPVMAPLADAATRLDRGGGTVWSGDARQGFNGGAVFVRWVREECDLADAVAFFAPRCDVVRVAPFVEGIPCSIHGIVFDDAVVALRPVELMTLRSSGGNRFRYAGCATFWDPPEPDRAAMRALVRSVGDHLRHRVAYRGAFTVDGIMGEHGFVATELNPRVGAGLTTIGRSVAELPLVLLHHAVVAGERWAFRPHELEALVVDAADARRAGGGWLTISSRRAQTEQHDLAGDQRGFVPAGEGDTADATLTIGPSMAGGFVRFEPRPDRVVPGPSIAPCVVAGFAAADRHWATDIGALEPALDLSVPPTTAS